MVAVRGYEAATYNLSVETSFPLAAPFWIRSIVGLFRVHILHLQLGVKLERLRNVILSP
jgi:hypothetical protein